MAEQGTHPKKKINWSDRGDSDITKDFFYKFTSDNKQLFEEYSFDHINDPRQIGTRDKDTLIIAVCGKTTPRLENVLDYCLEGVEECEFQRVLVIMIHIKDYGGIPKVSTRTKIEDTEHYDNLHNIIDVGLSMPYFRSKNILRPLNNIGNYWYYLLMPGTGMITIFGKEKLQKFLQGSAETTETVAKKSRDGATNMS